MKKITLLLIVCLTFFKGYNQNPIAYSIFRNDGSEVTFNEMANELALADVTLFGELHDNPIAHWLQHEICIWLNNNGNSLTLGAEMFETDNQLILNEYIDGLISQSRFEAEARLWPNYKTDYKPLVEFAKVNNIRFIATNIPRRYASMVATGGFEALDSLTELAIQYIAPLPIEYNPELPGYRAMLSMMGMPGKANSNAENFPKAQAIKDATMAWNISKSLSNGSHFIHFHGTYHSNNYEGIVWYLKRYSPKATYKTIATVLQNRANALNEEYKGIADFIIVVPERMTRTY